MRKLTLVLAIGVWIAPTSAFTQDKSADQQIGEAVMPLPEGLRAGAMVLGYGGSAALVTLREGSGDMVCLADDPSREGFHVACYHKDLEPFMSRGRELRSEGKSNDERKNMRRAEIKSGALKMPSQPTTLWSLTNRNGNGADGASGLFVVYVPYATEATIGIAERPSRGEPWLMEPGEPWAHIMISR